MFGLFKKKPANALDEFIFAVYGNPPPAKKADLAKAIEIAGEELLLGVVNESEVMKRGISLSSGPIPYSTHDLAVSIALNFFKQSEYIPHLATAQLAARLQVVNWVQEGLVVPVLAKSFEDVLYKSYKGT